VDDDDFEVDDDDDSADSTYNPSPALKKSIVPKPPIQLPSPCSLLNRTVTLPPINSVLKSNTHPIALARYPSFLTVEQNPRFPESPGLPREFAQFLRQINQLKTENISNGFN